MVENTIYSTKSLTLPDISGIFRFMSFESKRFDLLLDHPLQKKIFSRLMFVDSARFSELKPKGVESNIFMYHLKLLIKEDLVAKTGTGYVLSPFGMAYADKVTVKNLSYRVQPKIVNILCLEREDGQWLLYERLHQPFIHQIGYPFGKLHFGESIEDAAHRELREKADIDTKMQLKGMVNMRYTTKGVVITHLHGYVFFGKVKNDVNQACETLTGRTLWIDPKKVPKKKLIDGFWGVQELLKKPDFFFSEFDLHI